MEIKRRVKNAMIYPTMVMIFATLVLVGMLMFLVPVFVKIFGQLGGELPTLTQWVVKASNLLPRQVVHHHPGDDRFRRRLPPLEAVGVGPQALGPVQAPDPDEIGDVVLKVTMARFSRTLSTLVAAGVDIIKALEITGQTAGNWVVEEALADVRVRVHEACRSRSR